MKKYVLILVLCVLSCKNPIESPPAIFVEDSTAMFTVDGIDQWIINYTEYDKNHEIIGYGKLLAVEAAVQNVGYGIAHRVELWVTAIKDGRIIDRNVEDLNHGGEVGPGAGDTVVVTLENISSHSLYDSLMYQVDFCLGPTQKE